MAVTVTFRWKVADRDVAMKAAATAIRILDEKRRHSFAA